MEQILTGPVSGTVSLPDGTVYDVTPSLIEVADGHSGPVVHYIEKMHEAAGGLPVGGTRVASWTHTCTDACDMTPTAAATPAPTPATTPAS